MQPTIWFVIAVTATVFALYCDFRRSKNRPYFSDTERAFKVTFDGLGWAITSFFSFCIGGIAGIVLLYSAARVIGRFFWSFW